MKSLALRPQTCLPAGVSSKVLWTWLSFVLTLVAAQESGAQEAAELNLAQPANLTQSVRQSIARELFQSAPRDTWQATVQDTAAGLQQNGLVLGPQEFQSALVQAHYQAHQDFFQPNQMPAAATYQAFVENILELELPPRALGSRPGQVKAGAMALQEILTLAHQHRESLSPTQQAALDQKLVFMTDTMANSAEESLELSLELGRDLEQQLADLNDQPSHSPAARAQTYAVHDALYGGQDVSLRIDMLETGTGPYQDMPENKRRAMAQTLRKQQRLQNHISTAQDAVQAGHDVAMFLHSIDVIGDEDFEAVSLGLNLAGQSLNILGAAATGNIFGVISGSAQLLTTLFGKEPAPDPAIARHERVMAALNAVLDGQAQIMSTLESLSRQIDEVFNRLHSQTEKLGKVMRATKGLLLDAELKGLRDCQDYQERAIHYARMARDPVDGQWRQRLELGYHTYDAMALQFDLLGQTLFRSCQDFLNNTSRDSHLTLLSMASDRSQAARIAQALNQPLEWVEDFHLAEATRTDLMVQIIDEFFRPEYRNVILASMIAPPSTYEEVNQLVREIGAGEASELADLVTEFNLRDATQEFYNAELLQSMVDAQLFMMPLHLLTQAHSAELPGFRDVHAPAFDPLVPFGSNAMARFNHFNEPLRDLQRLTYQSLMQHGLYHGGVLIPLFSRLLISVDGMVATRSQQPNLFRMLTKIARRNPMLHENALKYRVYQALRGDGITEQARNITAYQQLLKPGYAQWFEGIRRERFNLPTSFLEEYFELSELPLTVNDGRRDVSNDHMFVLTEYHGFNGMRYELGERDDTSLDPRLGANFYARQSYSPREPGEERGHFVRLPGRIEVSEGRLASLDSVAYLRRGLRQLSQAWQQNYVDLYPDLANRERFQRTLWLQSYFETLAEPE